MMNLVSKFIRRIASEYYYLYYAMYRLCIDKESKWTSIGYVSSMLSLMITAPIAIALIDIPRVYLIIIILVMTVVLNRVFYKYYESFYEEIEKKYDSDSLWKRRIYGIVAVLLFFCYFLSIIT